MPRDPRTDEGFLRRAIRLAMGGRGAVEPNPMVGCVIVRAGGVVGEGFHPRYGQAHAEPNALADCLARGELPEGATAYVTLEPCSHTRKQTPPCVPRLIAAGLARVVVGCTDPNPAVRGKGIEQLRGAGIRVDVLEDPRARQLAAPFVARVTHRRPYVTLKWAESADGKIAGPGGRRAAISNARSLRAVHELRAKCDAILVGIGTVLKDDPLLTARGVPGARPLLRVVLDSALRLPAGSRLVRSCGEGNGGSPVRAYCSESTARTHPDRAAALRSLGVEVRPLPGDSGRLSGRLSLPDVLADLGRLPLTDLPLTHLLVEPGPTLAGGFFRDAPALWDRLWVFHSPNRIDDPTAPAAAEKPAFAGRHTLLDGDRLSEFLNPRGVYFADSPSADFLAAGGDDDARAC